MKPFVHLHSHTSYSLLDGAAKISEGMIYLNELVIVVFLLLIMKGI